MVLNLNILPLVTFDYFWSCGPQDQKYTLCGGICRIYLISYDYYHPYQEMVLNLNILLLVIFGYFWSCGPQDQKYTFGGGISRIYLTLYDYYQPYQ